MRKTKTRCTAILAAVLLPVALSLSMGCASGPGTTVSTVPGEPSSSSTTATTHPTTETSPSSTATTVMTTTVTVTTTVVVTTTAAVTTTLGTSTTEVPIPPFEWSIQPVDATLAAAMLESGSWRPEVPVSLDDLRLIRLSYWGFDGMAHTGRLVVNADWAERLGTVFRTLYEARFPFRSIELIDAYGADDDLSMAADNTSAFNGRYVGGTSLWSMHAYGLAVDINPVENPWVDGAEVSPPAGRRYTDRSLEAPGMIHSGDVVVQAFESIGWKWGGYWSGTKDYQHFSSNGR